MSTIEFVVAILFGAAVFIGSAGIPAAILVLGFKRHWRDAAIVAAVVPALCGVVGAVVLDPRPMHILTVAMCNLPIGFLIGVAVAYPLYHWLKRRDDKAEG